MSNFKKIAIIVAIVIVLLITVYVVAFGYVKNTSVYAGEYRVSADGTQMEIEFFVASPIGYIRSVKTHTDGDRMCVDFYQAFGGINGNIGAMEKCVFTVDLDDSINEICFYRGTSGYEQVLVKNSDGTWGRNG